MNSQLLTVFSLTVTIQTLLYVHTRKLKGGDKLLMVYRSPVVRDTDPAFAPVAKALEDFDATVVVQEMHQDPHMMSGQGEMTSYLLRERGAG